MFDEINLAILIGAALITLSALTSLISQRIGAPLLLVFLAIGLLAGEDGILGIEFDSGSTAYFIGSLALAIILFDSGFSTSLRSYRVAAAPALTLATVGVVLTTLIVGAGFKVIFGAQWSEGLLLGAIVASTDAAAVFFLLRVGGITIRERIRSTLEIESGANDPMAIFLTAVLVELAAAGGLKTLAIPSLAVTFGLQIGLGLVLGVVGGGLIVLLLRVLRDLDQGLYPIAAVAGALVLFAATGLVGGSGFLAAYVAGLVAGNARVRFEARIRRFQIGMTWLAQIGMFLTLGLLATPSEFETVLAPSLMAAAFLILIARPLAVWICLAPFRFSWREIAFVGWVGLRGAVSILLAILPGIGGVPDGQFFFNVVFVIVLVSLLTQGWTISFAARRLRLLSQPQVGLVDRIELDLPGKADVELVGYRIHPDSTIGKGSRVPRWARPLLIQRDGQAHSVHAAGPLQPNDRVYLFATPRQVRLLDAVYARPADMTDPEIYGHFALKAGATVSEIEHEYGITLGASPDRAIGELIMHEFQDHPVPGDRLTLGPVDLVVRSLSERGEVEEVGLVLSPLPERRIRSYAMRLINRVFGQPEEPRN
ncbi:potassium/proton antiporter [Hoeflea sp. CAU 1731]